MAPPFPQQFGKYVLVRKIATGGMAEIFQAKTAGAEGFEKDIVIKRILPHFSEDDAFVKMFIDEASITAKLQHSNIVQIFDFDVHDGAYYIAMEYVEGEDLSVVLKDGRAAGRVLSVAQCVWVTIELAKGLHYAHIKEHKGRPLNIIHRDISPHNAMIAFTGEVKLMDFGIAKAAERSTKTQAGTVKGKVAYMSPEQARGRSLDPRSDLFALATVLWEMLTQSRLFLRESDFETLTAVLKEPAPAPSRSRPGVDQELDDIILGALDKDRDRRQGSVEEFARELTRWYYKTVEDLERERLKPYMQVIYSDKIDALRASFDEGPAQRSSGRVRAETSRVPSRETTPSRDGPPSRRPPTRTGWAASEPKRQREVSEPAMTMEAPMPDILKAPAPRRPTSEAMPVAPPPASKRRGTGSAQVPSYFSSPETLMEDKGPSQAEVFAALERERQRVRDAGPDLTLDGRTAQAGRAGLEGQRAATRERSMTGTVLLLAVLMLVLGGIIAFLVAP